MILLAASRAFANLLAPQSQWLVVKSIGLAIMILAALWYGLRAAFTDWLWPWIGHFLPSLPDWAGWVGGATSIAASLGLALALLLLMAPVTMLMAGYYLDDMADNIEKRDYPSDPPGRPINLMASLWSAAKFAGLALMANLLGLILYFIPGVNIAAFFLINGYLIGREYFEFAAARHIGLAAARELRERHHGMVLLAGFVAALFMAIPFLNLLTPLFAAGLMVHLFKSLQVSPSTGLIR